ncbi:MAG: outer membrane protein assembly factor BamA [Candidatus Cloacimonetes bacterium HGW-Cloacimonetes-1]|nr:MAG: outer membrane protein assembly factor BamA [Candidatus Cloacimonetes bacterium HGW-Cloacimonetes-1]
MKHLVMILMLALVTCGLFAAGETIYDIRVEGTQNVDPQLVKSAISMQVGDAMDPEEVSKSLKNLYKLTIFSSVQFDSEPYRTGINIIIKVKEYPIVQEVDFVGFKSIKKDRIEELLTLKKGSYWSEYLKNQTSSKLKSELSGKGFSNADIEIEERPLADNKIAIRVVCDEGKRVAVSEITFIGNSSFTDKELGKRMKTKSSSLLRSGRFEQAKFDTDLRNVESYYKKNGYIDARISNWELKKLSDRHLELIITIEEGDKYTFGTVTVEGNVNFTTESIVSLFTLKTGEPFDQEKFDKQLGKVYALYFDEGYIYTSIVPEQKRDEQLLNINLKIEENTRARIRQIRISGNKKTKEKVLRRQLEIAPGDYYRQSQVILSQQNIYNMGFFEPDIKLDYDRINNAGDIDLHLDVVDKSSGVANGGIGYNSQDKFVGQLSLNQNNLFGNNWSSGIKWEFGGDTQNFEFSFTNPNLYDSDLLLGTNLYYTTKNWSSFYYEIFTRGAALRLGQSIPWINRTRLIGGYSLYSKKYRITNISQIDTTSAANATLLELNALDWRYTSSFNVTLSRDTRDNVFFPTSGTQLTLYSEIAGGILGGDFDYFKQIAQVNWYMEMWYKLALRTKWRFGYVTHYGRSNDAPPDEKFYLGGTGADGIRGYADRSIGPEGGGTREILFSTELGIPIGSDQIVGVLFFDAGNGYNKLREFNFLDFKKGVGAGVRIRSPFGLIGFDYAFNVEDHLWEPHLQFGTTF